ncbi:LTA synthase family protein [Novosphingobium sp.]|uniref:LTA synthase family protein n=1 Tax=Novosphingobium sp. TaxID=1874826 RepID=UPI003567A5BD
MAILLVFGCVLAVCGNIWASAFLAVGLIALFMMVSNAKRAMLGEPLVFSDLALIGAIFKHPQFYLSALSQSQKAMLVIAAPIVPGLMWWLFVLSLSAHLAGLAVFVAAAVLIKLSVAAQPMANLAHATDVEGDVARHGLLATLILHRARWRETLDPAPCKLLPSSPHPRELAIVIQCESFADPVEVFGDPALCLPGLASARAEAWQWGDLLVSGFGAYTMRTEYGVLFGRSEAELGFRRFDPYLTALGEGTYALPSRLLPGGWRSLFVHPHDMRFYNREQILGAGGFDELVGEHSFASPTPAEGRYVTDKAMAAEIIDLAGKAAVPTLIYAVTIENHGPWEAHATAGSLTDGYMRLVRNSDAMLVTLRAELAKLKRPTTLVFFGDHRPSIPGVSMPGGARHTPYVILRLDADGHILWGEGQRIDLTPAELHHTLLGLLSDPAA